MLTEIPTPRKVNPSDLKDKDKITLSETNATTSS